jgi:hypothetical protein
MISAGWMPKDPGTVKLISHTLYRRGRAGRLPFGGKIVRILTARDEEEEF